MKHPPAGQRTALAKSEAFSSSAGVVVPGNTASDSGRRIGFQPATLVGVFVVLLACLPIVFVSRILGALRLSERNVLRDARHMDDIFRELVQAGMFDGELTESSKRILQTWIRHDEEFLGRNEGDQALRFERAAAHKRAGNGLLHLRRHREAECHFRRAATLFEELRGEKPNELSYAHETYDTYITWAETLGHLGRGEDGVAVAFKAYETWEQTLQSGQEESESMLDWARFHEVRAYLTPPSQPELAIRVMSDVVEIRRRLCDFFPQDVNHAQALSKSCAALEVLFERSGRFTEATRVRAGSLAILKDLVLRFPADDRLRASFARAQTRADDPSASRIEKE